MTVLNDGKNVRQIAGEILHRVECQNSYADLLLDHHLRSADLNDADRALLTELTYGTLRWRGKIDSQLVPFLNRSLAETDSFNRNLLRVTLYQLLFLDKIPAYAAVNEAVEIAKATQPRSAAFVNGVLRSFLRQLKKGGKASGIQSSAGNLADEYSHPQWLVDRWREYFGDEQAKALMLASNQRTPLVVRVNLGKTSREKLLASWHEQDIAAEPTAVSPQAIRLPTGVSIERLPGFTEGLFQVQSEASQLVSYLVGPASGDLILDACAAPGGKATHLAELIGDQGNIIAIDTSARGVERINQNAERLGLGAIQTKCANASKTLPPKLTGPYDRILVDAPCSGLGTLRSHPEIKWQRDNSDIARLCALQARILQSVTQHLKIGGVLVYSTCTLTVDENERVVEDFLRDNSRFELVDAARYLPESARHMVHGKYFQALPQRDDTDGFFAARMRKAA
ncbi:MAG: 16S rRNA (cytosine(967)-C(5))-methyltransferase RsmB [Candidatus Binatota bacterium]|nr:16S rRNA (cytosine(967)-C(5))-methyltransferase RsmB [Candidatus Binatota bacterium]